MEDKTIVTIALMLVFCYLLHIGHVFIAMFPILPIILCRLSRNIEDVTETESLTEEIKKESEESDSMNLQAKTKMHDKKDFK